MSSLRGQFLTPADGIYLLSHSVGLAPASLQAHIEQHYFQPWHRAPQSVWRAWLAEIEKFRSVLARLFNASAAEFCPQSNVSSALTKILHAFPTLKERPVVVLAEESFPSLGYVFQKALEARLELRYIPASLDTTDLATWDQYLGVDVGIALITHVHSNTGEQLPVGDIVARARAKNILTVVDSAQSNGVLPIDLQKWSPDFLVGSCVKWLCGGPGAGFMWINPIITAEALPIDVGWFSHENPFEFDIRDFRYANDALRFWGGTPAVLPYVAATHSIGKILDIGIDIIREHNLALTGQLIDGLHETQLASPRSPERRSGTVIVRAARSDGLEARLEAAGIRFDAREHGVRLSPHIYNTTAEIQRVIECLR